MKAATYEATVENGQIRLSEPVILPEHARVYVVVPGVEAEPRDYDVELPPRARIMSPRLANPKDAAYFVKEVTEVSRDAGL